LKARKYGFGCTAAALLLVGTAVCSASDKAAYVIVGDAITEPLQGLTGDAARGRAIVANRQIGLCLLCHTAPIPEERFQGNLSQSLAGVGSRASEGQLRMRLVDARKLNPQTIMPSYYRAENLTRVSPALQGRTIFSAQQIEDVVAYLLTLRDDDKSDEKSK
jgi:L-cysteine S-thiosulfotransferase